MDCGLLFSSGPLTEGGDLPSTAGWSVSEEAGEKVTKLLLIDKHGTLPLCDSKVLTDTLPRRDPAERSAPSMVVWSTS